MAKSDWLYRQLDWIEKDSKNWPAWMKEGMKIECLSENSQVDKKEEKVKNQKKQKK